MNRREFTKTFGAILLAASPSPAFYFSEVAGNGERVPIGLCNHSLRSMRLNAKQLIEYAIEQELDSVLLNTFQPLESLDTKYLTNLRSLADANGVSIYIGAGSISEKSGKFSKKYSSAKELLTEGIRVATALGSPVLGVRIGNINDRYTQGGIDLHVEASVAAMKSVRTRALDAGLKFAFENHAGDLRSEELLALINETGNDVCGALFDPANAVWAMEDPMIAMQNLGSNILCTSVRDVMAWETEEGAIFQGMAIGDGMVDFKKYTTTMAKLCPGVPMHVETISNSQRPVPFKQAEFLDGFPKLSKNDIADFLKFLSKGVAQELIQHPEGISKKEFDIQLQQSELLKSFRYLRKECHAGLK